ncbi:hypothetical protein ACJRO7_011669 [Eucalyptus globulus]|uniref:MADS-box domain-containing protein n=1 Tax=Eucalyptus globulus TaxID=34317 RepID=A0ABD3LJC8_EUCGL
MARRRRKVIKFVEDPKERSTTRCKRCNGLRKKTEELHTLTRNPVAPVTINPKGKCHYVCEPTIPEMTSNYRRLQGDVMRMERWEEWLD